MRTIKHYGDITKLHGDEIPVVDVITGGSPCQDLSNAGKRAGLAGERSGLFFEQIRIIKEMREHDRNTGRPDESIRPRYMVWENVPGAFSSGTPKGADFQVVLTEIARIAKADAPDVPLPDKWGKSGCLMGIGTDGCPFSIAWRLHDAQFWGVAQRRKRIALVADFGGGSAPEILFEREGLHGDSGQSGKAWEETSGDSGLGVEESGQIDEFIAAANKEAAGESGNNKPMVCTMAKPVVGCNIGGQAETFSQSESMYTLRAETNGAVMPVATNVFGAEVSPTLVSSLSTPVGNTQDGFNVVCMDVGWIDSAKESAPPLLARQYKDPPIVIDGNDVAGTLDLNGRNQVNAACVGGNDVAQTLDASYYKGPGSRNGKEREVVALAHSECVEQDKLQLQASVVRRLTPLECERLQGFPDGWTDIGDWTDSKGKVHKASDSARYKALGNSIAVGYANNASGFWCWLLKRISAQYERNATLGSLFDGIGGFPLAWEHYNGKGSAIWASEIEEFCIAVTKIRFPEAEDETVHPV